MHRTIDYETKTDLQLVELAKLDDVDARNALALRHSNLIRHIIRKYGVQNKEDCEDLFQDCFIAFCKAIDKYKFEHKTKITSYAALWIHAHIRVELAKRRNEIRLFIPDCNETENEDTMTYKSPIENFPTITSIDVVNVLTEEERELVESLFNHKAKLTDVAISTHSTMGQVFFKKEKLFKKLRKIIRNDNEHTERAQAIISQDRKLL